MSRFLIMIWIIPLLILSSCTKDRFELLKGRWEVVNVEDINDPYIYEWEFNNGEVIMYRKLKIHPDQLSETDRGFYTLDNHPINPRLQISNTSQQVINDNWDILKLDEEQLIIQLEIVGGILYKEFIKII